MPIDYQIDHERRLVLARGRGAITAEDMFRYQHEAWSDPRTTGYDELVDMSDVERVVDPDPDRMRELAALSAAADPPGGAARFAIVAPDNLTFGLGRMYEAFRDLEHGGTKQVAVFRSRAEAFAWLGIEAVEGAPPHRGA